MILDGDARALRLAVDVLRAGGPPPATSVLSDGSIGWHMQRLDDCWACAIATSLQIPLSELPDAHIDRRLTRGETVEEVDKTAWADMLAWLDGRGLKLVRHDRPPQHLARWIGVVPVDRPFQSHNLVCAGSRVLFDPSVRPGVRTFYFVEIEFGYELRKQR
jgi:hypothetical protein